ncbi:MAG: type II methionyl aminopeptidase [Aigarchaeota archaeon]|nr:type II methionyl aminopeptidase [Candidatus Wolframiiraptor gerlachensis]
MLSEDALDRLRQAGLIARRAREEACKLIREAALVIEICEAVEEIIRLEGARPAFPCNVGINEVAAHYTSPPGDQLRIPPRSLVKVDVGASLDGYIADTAATVALSPELEPMVEAARIVLQEAIRAMRAGVPVSRIGLTVQEAASRLGFKPIRNLTGHEIRRNQLHAGMTIPNVGGACPGRLEAGHIYAVEPFLTTMRGAGEVVSAKIATIYRVEPEKTCRQKLREDERRLIQYLAEKFGNLPYAVRWIEGYEKVKDVHERLVKSGRIQHYPVLVERLGEPVAQAEHTVIVYEDGCEIIT